MKRLRFDHTVKVTLIPCINEYKDAGLHLKLWCSKNELQCYRDSAYIEIQNFMKISACENFSIAMKSLFQSDPATEDIKEGNENEEEDPQLGT